MIKEAIGGMIFLAGVVALLYGIYVAAGLAATLAIGGIIAIIIAIVILNDNY